MKTFSKMIAAAAFAAAIVGFATPSQAGFSIFSAFKAQPKVEAVVSISRQTMVLTVTDRDGRMQTATWKVSTGKTGFETPTGEWNPTWLSKDHVSKTYDNAPMPFAVFFTGGYAIHATDAVARLGKPASHGCVRLSKDNAATFFKLVSAYGRSSTSITIVN